VSDVRRQIIFGQDDFTVVESQDVAPYLDANKAAYNDGTNGYTPSRELRHVAEIPFIVALEWMNKFGVNVFDKNHKPAVRRLLNSSDYLYLRTAPGQLQR
jgi:hypothetical protein